MNILNNIKYILVVLAFMSGVWLYKDYKFQIAENKRQSENFNQLLKADSAKYAVQILSEQQINDYLEYSNKDLKKNLQESNIKIDRIESIVSQTLKYRDNTVRSYDLSDITKGIQNKIPAKVPFTDSSKCLTIKGFIEYKNDSLKLNVTNRDFKNKSDAVAYWERRQWKFLGIKTRVFGKKQFTAKNFDQCGESTVMKIEKAK